MDSLKLSCYVNSLGIPQTTLFSILLTVSCVNSSRGMTERPDMATRTVLSPVPGETTPRNMPETSRSQTQHGPETWVITDRWPEPEVQTRSVISALESAFPTSSQAWDVPWRASALGDTTRGRNKHLAHTFPVPRSILSTRAGSTSNWKVRNRRAARVQGAFQPPHSHLRAQTANHTHHHTPSEMIHI